MNDVGLTKTLAHGLGHHSYRCGVGYYRDEVIGGKEENGVTAPHHRKEAIPENLITGRTMHTDMSDIVFSALG